MIHLIYPFQTSKRSLLKTALFSALLFIFQLTASAQTTTCNANAGTLDAIDVCLLTDQTILKATNRGDTTVPQGFQVLYVLTRTSALIIEQVSNEPVFSLDDSLSGIYTIHTLVYNPLTLNLNTIVLGQTTGFQVNALLIQGGGTICASLDVRGAKVRFGSCEEDCIATAGRLNATTSNCLRDGKATLSAAVQYAPIIPPGYTRRYVLTRGDSLVIEKVSTTPSFVVNAIGKYTIHTLVYDSTTLNLNTIVFGQTTGFQVNALLLQGGGTICGALDVAGAKFNVSACPPVCTAQAGKLKPDNDPCLQNGKATLIAAIYQNSIVPQGYQVRYVLTSGYGLVIQQVSATPTFVVNTTGLYTIHTLVYNPNTLNLDNIQLGTTQASTVNSWLIQGGGSICGSLDLTGATFQIKVCPPPVCSAKAGKLYPESNPCLLDGKAILKAKYSFLPVVPEGYKVLFLLSYGNNLVIEQKSIAASFLVNYTGKYRIHTLVYNPNTLNLANILLNETTIFELYEWLVPGGGYICGALDGEGASFYIQECVTCLAKAGKIKPANEPCLLNDTTTLKVQNVVAPVVPVGYAVRYLLATPWSNTQIIRKISKTPAFLVEDDGTFTVHTLVYDSTTLNLTNIKLNITTIQDVHKWLIQGGGNICGALDLEGAKFQIKECEETPCPVKAGTLVALRNKLCIFPGNSALLSAYHIQQPILTTDYKVKYVLTSGANLVIQKISDLPNFQVNSVGTYRIHTLVYNPNTLNLNTIQLGITKAADVNALLLQGGGAICAALDVAGAAFDVSNCADNGFNKTGLINAYPNPSTGIVNLAFDKTEKVRTIRVELMDVSGNVLKTWTFDGEMEQATLDINEVNAGMYNVRILYDDRSIENLRVAKASF